MQCLFKPLALDVWMTFGIDMLELAASTLTIVGAMWGDAMGRRPLYRDDFPFGVVGPYLCHLN